MYELCIKLKEAGFPQEIKPRVKRFIGRDGSFFKEYCRNFAYVPELSEVIDALGPRFIYLKRYESGWLASGEGLKKDETGKTALEAAMKLYLKLNQ